MKAIVYFPSRSAVVMGGGRRKTETFTDVLRARVHAGGFTITMKSGESHYCGTFDPFEFALLGDDEEDVGQM